MVLIRIYVFEKFGLKHTVPLRIFAFCFLFFFSSYYAEQRGHFICKFPRKFHYCYTSTTFKMQNIFLLFLFLLESIAFLIFYAYSFLITRLFFILYSMSADIYNKIFMHKISFSVFIFFFFIFFFSLVLPHCYKILKLCYMTRENGF